MNLIRTATIDLNNHRYHRYVVFVMPEIRIRNGTSFEGIIPSRGQMWYVDRDGIWVFSRVNLNAIYKDFLIRSFNYGYQGMIHDQINKLPWGERYEIS